MSVQLLDRTRKINKPSERLIRARIGAGRLLKIANQTSKASESGFIIKNHPRQEIQIAFVYLKHKK